MSERKARRRRPMRMPMLLPSERGDETETRKEAYGDPIPQNVNFLDQKSKVILSDCVAKKSKPDPTTPFSSWRSRDSERWKASRIERKGRPRLFMLTEGMHQISIRPAAAPRAMRGRSRWRLLLHRTAARGPPSQSES